MNIYRVKQVENDVFEQSKLKDEKNSCDIEETTPDIDEYEAFLIERLKYDYSEIGKYLCY